MSSLIKNINDALLSKDESISLRLNLKSELQLPEEIYLIKSLNELHLTLGEMKELTFKSILPIKKLSIRGEKLESIDKRLFTFSKLVTLEIKSSLIKHLPEIEVNNTLSTFMLINSQLTDLPESFSNLKNLKRLILDGNRLERLPKAILLLKKLSHLSIDENPISEDEKASIERALNIWF